MQQHELHPPRGAKKNRKRVGRGDGSGLGTYSGKGIKGQQSRSGYKTRPFFEGGQTPLVRRLPHKRGFKNPFRVEYLPVSLTDLARIPDGTAVTPESLRDAGVIHSVRVPVKVLGDGDVAGAITVKVHRVSASAKAKIEAAGGTVEELTPRKDPSQKRDRSKKKNKKNTTPVAEATGDETEDTADTDVKKESEPDSETDGEQQDGE